MVESTQQSKGKTYKFDMKMYEFKYLWNMFYIYIQDYVIPFTNGIQLFTNWDCTILNHAKIHN